MNPYTESYMNGTYTESSLLRPKGVSSLSTCAGIIVVANALCQILIHGYR